MTGWNLDFEDPLACSMASVAKQSAPELGDTKTADVDVDADVYITGVSQNTTLKFLVMTFLNIKKS
jgi:hypothetical protein